MSLNKQVVKAGDGVNYPKEKDDIKVMYTGWLFESSAPQNRGKKFDSSRLRGDFETKIGVGRVIKGWDIGVLDMSLGEVSVFTIPGPLAYGSQGFPGLIPPDATLIFEIELKSINDE